MPHIRVVTDSTCDIPEALLRQFDITVVPLSVRWQDGSIEKAGPLSSTHLRRLGVEALPEVIAPSVDDLARTYRSLRETCDGVLSIHVCSRMSETFTNAAIAREAFGPVGYGGPFPVAVADSQSVSMGLGWVVLAVARAARTGLDLQRLSAVAARLRDQSHVAFITETAEGLVKSGGLANPRENFNALRPLYHLDEGQITVYERTRTRAKARDALYNFVEDFPKIGDIAVVQVGAQNDLEHLLTRVGAIYPRERITLVQPNLAVASWLGPESLAVAVFEGEEQ